MEQDVCTLTVTNWVTLIGAVCAGIGAIIAAYKSSATNTAVEEQNKMLRKMTR